MVSYLAYEQGFVFRVMESGVKESHEKVRQGEKFRDGKEGRIDV